MNEKRYYALYKESDDIQLISFTNDNAEHWIKRLKTDMNLTEKRLTKKNETNTIFLDKDNIGDNEFILIFGQEVDKIDL